MPGKQKAPSFRRIAAALFFALALCLGALPLSSRAMEGFPAATRNYYPPHLMFLTPRPDTPALLPRGSLALDAGIDYSSVYVNEHSGRWLAFLDLEMAVIDFRVEYGPAEWLTLSLDLPLVSLQSGFLDQPLAGYHRTFGFPDAGRSKQPDNQFAYSLQRDGRDLFNAARGGLAPADSVLAAKMPIVRKSRAGWFSAALSGAVKLPTGDSETGLGSGRTDYGLFLLALAGQKRLAFLLNAGCILLSDPDWPETGIVNNTIWSVAAGGRYAISENWSLSALLNSYTSPFHGTGIRELDKESHELTFALSRRLSETLILEMAFSEDPAGRGAPDFNLHLGLRTRLTSARSHHALPFERRPNRHSWIKT